jgi:hypothetical protein
MILGARSTIATGRPQGLSRSWCILSLSLDLPVLGSDSTPTLPTPASFAKRPFAVNQEAGS